MPIIIFRKQREGCNVIALLYIVDGLTLSAISVLVMQGYVDCAQSRKQHHSSYLYSGRCSLSKTFGHREATAQRRETMLVNTHCTIYVMC